MAGVARRRRVLQAEEPGKLPVAHDYGGLVVAPAAVARLAGDSRDGIGRIRALLVAGMAGQAERRLVLLGTERGNRARVRSLCPDAVGLRVAGPAALRADQVGRERGRGQREEEGGESEAHRKVAERISGSGAAQRKTARDGR